MLWGDWLHKVGYSDRTICKFSRQMYYQSDFVTFGIYTLVLFAEYDLLLALVIWGFCLIDFPVTLPLSL